MAAPQRFGGLDGAQAPRALALRPTGERWAVTNEAPGRVARVARLQAVRAVAQATGPLAKTAARDARAWAHGAAAGRPAPPAALDSASQRRSLMPTARSI